MGSYSATAFALSLFSLPFSSVLFCSVPFRSVPFTPSVERAVRVCIPFPSSCTKIAGGALSLRGLRGGRIFRGTHLAYDSELSCRIENFKVECSVICNVSLRTKNLYGKSIFKDDRNVSRKISITLSSHFTYFMCAIKEWFSYQINLHCFANKEHLLLSLSLKFV